MIKYTTGFVDKLEDILQESNYTVRYERGNFQSGWCLLDHKRVVVLNKFLNTEGRVNTLVELIPQLKIDYDKLTLNSQKLFEFLTENRLETLSTAPSEDNNEAAVEEEDEAVPEVKLQQDREGIVTEGKEAEETGADHHAAGENDQEADDQKGA